MVCQIFFKLEFSKFIQNFRTLNVFSEYSVEMSQCPNVPTPKHFKAKMSTSCLIETKGLSKKSTASTIPSLGEPLSYHNHLEI